jgi:hypothetical protein
MPPDRVRGSRLLRVQEDQDIRVNGQWFVSKRKIYNEGSGKWQYKGGVNPAW